MKKLFAIILCVAIMFTMAMGVSAYTINKDDAEIGADDIFPTAVYFEDAEAKENENVTVDLMLENNPGVTEVKVTFALPEGIAIESVAAGDFGTASIEGNVVTVESDEAFLDDGCIAKVTFTATELGEKKITLTATAKNGEEDVNVNGSDCIVNVIEAPAYIPGDVDGDGDVDTTDLATIKLYLVGLEDEAAAGADANEDGLINATDLAELKLILVKQ